LDEQEVEALTARISCPSLILGGVRKTRENHGFPGNGSVALANWLALTAPRFRRYQVVGSKGFPAFSGDQLTKLKNKAPQESVTVKKFESFGEFA